MRTSETPPRSGREEHERAERFVDSLLSGHGVLRVLAVEAGDRFELRPPAFVVGVETVQAERPLRHDADEYRRVDLQRIELESSGYEVILCCNVLEHVRRPLAVLTLLRDGLRKGGLMVIIVPNVSLLKVFSRDLLRSHFIGGTTVALPGRVSVESRPGACTPSVCVPRPCASTPESRV